MAVFALAAGSMNFVHNVGEVRQSCSMLTQTVLCRGLTGCFMTYMWQRRRCCRCAGALQVNYWGSSANDPGAKGSEAPDFKHASSEAVEGHKVKEDIGDNGELQLDLNLCSFLFIHT